MIGAMLGLMAGLVANAAVAEVRLPAGSVIEPGDVSGCEAPCMLIGRQVSRTVFAGRALRYADTQAPDAVGRNARVVLILRSGAMRLEAKGRSLGSGPVGAEIDVMNDESRRVVTGTILSVGIVEVSL